jgi:hypothetical protein
MVTNWVTQGYRLNRKMQGSMPKFYAEHNVK